MTGIDRRRLLTAAGSAMLVGSVPSVVFGGGRWRNEDEHEEGPRYARDGLIRLYR